MLFISINMFVLKLSYPYFRSLCKKTMKHFFAKMKVELKDGRDKSLRWRKQRTRAQPGTSCSTRSMVLPAPTTGLLEFGGVYQVQMHYKPMTKLNYVTY